MNPKPENQKASGEKSARKNRKGTTETSRLFLDIDEVIRRPFPAPLTRYVE
jgi:hypothetical protein